MHLFGGRRGPGSGLDALLERRDEDDPSSLAWFARWKAAQSTADFLASTLYARSRGLPLEPVVLHPSRDGRVGRAVVVVCVADTHNVLVQDVPDGDVLVHAGDLTETGTREELDATVGWLRSLPHRHKIVIAGNHDAVLAEPGGGGVDWAGISYLCDSTAELDVGGRTVVVHGSPWTPCHGSFAFQYPRSDAAEQWAASVPAATAAGGRPRIDLLVTHGPGRGHCDGSRRDAGCPELARTLWRVRPAVHVFGHIHAGRGAELLPFDPAQRWWETVCSRAKPARGGGGRWTWADVARLAVLLARHALARYWPGVRGAGDRATVAVNAAVKGGLRDRLIRRPVVVVI